MNEWISFKMLVFLTFPNLKLKLFGRYIHVSFSSSLLAPCVPAWPVGWYAHAVILSVGICASPCFMFHRPCLDMLLVIEILYFWVVLLMCRDLCNHYRLSSSALPYVLTPYVLLSYFPWSCHDLTKELFIYLLALGPKIFIYLFLIFLNRMFSFQSDGY